ncbi:peptide chain release factor 2 [Clostridium aestuarii]|uniref:Peptide chain release factor 2 n=1 Tax=Clostridium aestuarii TaxID=338193 RepID=A0ABT4D333_9CLOT|nr:peptide chain release factor 2 [Clostridium aestuarii]MCY6485646.1 peptide chain release factor 2 [Clostridium aestuarii]
MIIQLEEAKNKSIELEKKLDEVRVSLDIASIENNVSELENRMQESNFWDDINRAQEITQEAKNLKDKLDKYNNTKNRLEDIAVLIQMSIEEEDEFSIDEIKNEINEIQSIIEQFKIEILLSGEYDKNNAILTLHSGAGGTDAQDWTEMLLRMYKRWSERKGYKVEILDLLPGDEAGIKSAELKITGEFAYGYLKAEKGIHRLVRISPFNANGKRQTSFASMEVVPELTKSQDIEIKSEDLRVDTYRASGAGGQHINKTDSAVRITHIPTGIVVQCQNERSQFQNKETAMSLLKSKLVELKERAHKEKIEDLTGDLKDNGWGSQIRSYVFQPYTMVKDHRTNTEMGNVDAVMDGDIDIFIIEFLKRNKDK